MVGSFLMLFFLSSQKGTSVFRGRVIRTHLLKYVSWNLRILEVLRDFICYYILILLFKNHLYQC